MCSGMCVDMPTAASTALYGREICIDMCMDVCVDMCLDMPKAAQDCHQRRQSQTAGGEFSDFSHITNMHGVVRCHQQLICTF